MSNWETLKADAAFLQQNLGALSQRDQEFGGSLVEQFNTRGLSPKQEYWVGELAKRAREAVARKAQPAQPAARIDLTSIVALFRKASTNLKKPYVLVDALNPDHDDRLRLKLAGPSSKYAGQVYVYLDGAFEERLWLGRVDPERMAYIPSRDAERERMVEITERALVAFAADPAGAATRFGRKVGACCFCSRTLNDPRSITVGYGPICAEHFGLPWGEVVEVQDFEQPGEELGSAKRAAIQARQPEVFEYAGFRYAMGEDGQASPLPGQHPAAGKERHIRAAQDEFASLRQRKERADRKAWALHNTPGPREHTPFDDEIPF